MSLWGVSWTRSSCGSSPWTNCSELFSVDGAPAGIRTRDLQLERLECLAGLHHRSMGGLLEVDVFICFPGVVFLSGLVGYC